MFNLRRNRTADAVETEAGASPNESGAASGLARLRFSPFNIGTQVAGLVVIGILMIAGLALIGEARLASTASAVRAERTILDTDRTEVTVALANAQRAEATSSGYLDAFGRAGDSVVSGRSTSAAADLAERSITDFAQSLQPLDTATRAFAVATAKSVYLRPWDESVENAQEAAFIKASKERITKILQTAQDLPGALAGVVIDNQEMTAAIRSGNIADARDLYLTRQAPKIAAIDQSLRSLRANLIEFSSDLATRHSSISRATESEAEDTYSGQRASIRLQILLLMLVLCAGGALIAIYGLAMPLADLTAAAARFAEGRFETPTTVLGRRDEIGKLSRALERLRETVATEKKSSDQLSRVDREAQEAERLERNIMEREIGQLRRDREKLEQELASRDQAATQISPEALEQERARLQAELTAEANRRMSEAAAAHKAALDAAQASAKKALEDAQTEIARLRDELEKKASAPAAPTNDPAVREALTKAETDVARLKIEIERQKASAAAQAKSHQDAVARAQAEMARLSEETAALRNAHAPEPVVDTGAQEALAKAEAEIAKLQDDISKLRASSSGESELRQSLAQARAEIDRLKNERIHDRNIARNSAKQMREALEAKLTQVSRDSQAEIERLAKAAQIAAADEQARQRLASDLALAKQQHEDDLKTVRATHARELAELRRRMAELQSDRMHVLNELANTFESSVANTVSALQIAARDVSLVSGRIDDATSRVAQRRSEVAARVTRATTSIHSASSMARNLTGAFDQLAQQISEAGHAATGATISARAATDAVQSLETAAARMNEIGLAITDLAERTNVLSLNASIEAAKAGDAGKGFVVVAAEIKSLANRAARTGKEISDRIKTVVSATGTVRSAVTGVGRAVGEIEDLTGKTSRVAAQQGATTASIASGIEAAVEGADSMNHAVAETILTIEASEQAVTQAKAAVDGLSTQVQDMRRQIEDFLNAIRSA